MSDIAALKEEHQPKDWERLKIAIRTRISVQAIGAHVAVERNAWCIAGLALKRQFAAGECRSAVAQLSADRLVAGQHHVCVRRLCEFSRREIWQQR